MPRLCVGLKDPLARVADVRFTNGFLQASLILNIWSAPKEVRYINIRCVVGCNGFSSKV